MTGMPWLLETDVETTGTGRGVHVLEVGFRVLDRDLEALAERAWVVPYTPRWVAALRALAEPVVVEMHDRSGLWVACVEEAQRADRYDPADNVDEWLESLVDEIAEWVAVNAPGKLRLCGSSVHHDRAWLIDFVPGFADMVHHRVVDVSTVKSLVEEWWPELAQGRPEPRKTHRVLPDMEDTSAELAFYRSRLALAVTE
jgi:oligoribonuclease